MQQSLSQQLSEFRSLYPIKTIKVKQNMWSYYDIGKSKDVIVIFPDIMGTYESWFLYIPLFPKKHRIIIPFYPPISDLKNMVSELHAFLQAQDVKSYILIASSLGGLFAQEYVREFPDEVERLLLIGTGTADKVLGIIGASLFATWFYLPEIWVKYFVYLAAYLSLSVTKEQKSFWLTYLKKQIWKVNTRQSLIAWGKCVLQLCWKYEFKPSDLKEWNKPIYLIESTNDLVFNPLTRRHLRNLYPQATCYTLINAQHLIWINRFAEVSKILFEFIP